jgi:hypothetical protein
LVIPWHKFLTPGVAAEPEYTFDANMLLPDLDGLDVFHRLLRGQEQRKTPLGAAGYEGELLYNGNLTQRLHKHLRAVPPSVIHYMREEFLQNVGVYDLVNRRDPPFVGPLDELRAPSLQAGYFKIAPTKKPEEHLMFDESGGRPTVKLLDFESIFRLYIPQRIGLTRYVFLDGTILIAVLQVFQLYF